MGFLHEERRSDSPYIESVIRGRTVGNGSMIRPAESHWHMVIARLQDDDVRVFAVGPWTSAGTLSYIEGVELLWIKFALGAYLPHLPLRNLLNREMPLPGASCQSFWLHGSTWRLPDFDNAETFIDRLARQDVLARDAMVEVVLQQRPHDLSSRTVRHRFLYATGLAQSSINQFERARQAESLLRQGVSIPDTVYELGYFDQPHLTRSLKRWIGQTPGQLHHAVQDDQLREIG